MYKLYTLIVSIVLVAVASAQLEPLSTNNVYRNSTERTIDYININKLQYNRNVQDMDTKIDMFEQNYAGCLNTIVIQSHMLFDSLNQMEEKLRPLEYLSDLSKKCVTKYRPLIPTVNETKIKIDSCVTAANYKLSDMLSAPTTTRMSLQRYYQTTFESNVAYCQKKYSELPLNYTMCVTDMVATTNNNTIKMQKTFAIEMDSAQCRSDANIKEALDCSYTTERNAISGIAEANTSINNCIQCNQGYTCSEVYNMYRSEVSYSSSTMSNPFFQRYQATKCMMINLIGN